MNWKTKGAWRPPKQEFQPQWQSTRKQIQAYPLKFLSV